MGLGEGEGEGGGEAVEEEEEGGEGEGGVGVGEGAGGVEISGRGSRGPPGEKRGKMDQRPRQQRQRTSWTHSVAVTSCDLYQESCDLYQKSCDMYTGCHMT